MHGWRASAARAVSARVRAFLLPSIVHRRSTLGGSLYLYDVIFALLSAKSLLIVLFVLALAEIELAHADTSARDREIRITSVQESRLIINREETGYTFNISRNTQDYTHARSFSPIGKRLEVQ